MHIWFNYFSHHSITIYSIKYQVKVQLFIGFVVACVCILIWIFSTSYYFSYMIYLFLSSCYKINLSIWIYLRRVKSVGRFSMLLFVVVFGLVKVLTLKQKLLIETNFSFFMSNYKKNYEHKKEVICCTVSFSLVILGVHMNQTFWGWEDKTFTQIMCNSPELAFIIFWILFRLALALFRNEYPCRPELECSFPFHFPYNPPLHCILCKDV